MVISFEFREMTLSVCVQTCVKERNDIKICFFFWWCFETAYVMKRDTGDIVVQKNKRDLSA